MQKILVGLWVRNFTFSVLSSLKLRPQSINWLVCISFAIKDGTGSFNHQCTYQQNKVRWRSLKGRSSFLSHYFYVYLFVLSIFIMYVCIYQNLFTNTGPILDSEVMGAYFGTHVLVKVHFACSHSLNRCHF